MPLLPAQLEINGLALGDGTPYLITDFSTGGLPDLRTDDRDRFYGDGMDFGVDLREGATVPIGLTIDTYTYADASAALQALLTAWDGRGVREFPGDVVPLRVRLFPEAKTTMCYGRPRKLSLANEQFMDRGRVDVELEFRGQDNLWYEDIERTSGLDTSPPVTSGWTVPFTVPLGVATTDGPVGEVYVRGNQDTWLQARVYGPCVNPIITNVGRWQARLDVAITAGAWIDIDARPWMRSVTRSTGEPLDGAFRPNFTPLSQLILVPGVNELAYDATDGTGTSSLLVKWRGASNTPYW